MKRGYLTSIIVGVVASIVSVIATLSYVSSSTPSTPHEEANKSVSEPTTPNSPTTTYPDLSIVAEQATDAIVYITDNYSGHGSGVIISEDGYVITNLHVVNEMYDIRVRTTDDKYHNASVVGYDEENDIALLKIECDDSTTFSYLPFGDSEALRTGEWVLAMGYPYDLDLTTTVGVVSGKVRLNGAYSTTSYIQSDALINPGNSGGALINTNGELVGINTEMGAGLFHLDEYGNRSNYGYSFSVPSSIVKKCATDIKVYGMVEHASLGIEVIDMGYSLKDEENEQAKRGVKIVYIQPESAAHLADLREGDIIISINGVDTNEKSLYMEQIKKYRPGDVIEVTIIRHNVERTHTITLLNRDGSDKSLVKNADISSVSWEQPNK
jgi:S1-C subfamily serine protease